MNVAGGEKLNTGDVREGGAVLRCFVAFAVLCAVLFGVTAPSFIVKRNAARMLYENLTFVRIAVESRQHIQKIEYGVKNGRELERFYNIDGILRDIQRCSSYIEGVYVIGSGDVLLYSLEQPSEVPASLQRPRELVFENENDYYIYGNSGFYDLLLPIYTDEGTAYVIIRLDGDIVYHSTSGLVRQELMRSLVISLELLGLGLIIIMIKKPKAAGICVLTFLIAIIVLSLDFGLSYTRYSGIADSATVQSVNRIAQMLQNDINTLRARGVSPDAIYDLNSWLTKSVQGIPMIHTMSINSNMQVTLTVSRAYVAQYSAGLLKSYTIIYVTLAAAIAATIIIYRTLRRKELKVES